MLAAAAVSHGAVSHVAAGCSTHLTWVQAIVVGFVQGITELFPVSSLGHSVLIPELFGWHDLVRSQDCSESFWLAFVVALHVANAIALLAFFWRDWVRIIKGFFTSLAKRRAETSAERLAWLIIVATIPVGIAGLLLEHKVRTLLAKPTSAAVFLAINGLILLAGQRVRNRSAAGHSRPSRLQSSAVVAGRGGQAGTGGNGGGDPADVDVSARVARLPYREALLIGVVQISALIAGISRDGVTMVTGLVRGLDNEDAAKFAFLLATPPILAAGLLKIGDLTGPLGAGVRGQIIAGAVVTFVASLFAVRYLTRFFQNRTLTPFGIYCVVFGIFMVIFVAAGG
ncbi:MAG: undecaprenyl-diphosphate phosphatase [Actinomycetota bacterium]|nr:undecaprenyl-diphosphate phosphatase [Actinomycetota bacterium]